MRGPDTQSVVDSTGRIAGLTIVNAMVFQEVLADYESRVLRLRQLIRQPDVVSAFADHWNEITTQINYHPIFHVAEELVRALPSNPDAEKAVRDLAQIALDIVRQRAALRHDLMGRVYHKLLTTAKYLGTYYTSVPAATLLLKLTLKSEDWKLNWGDEGALGSLRIADLACGTGTLLMAAAEAVSDNYLRACGEQRKTPKLDIFSRLLMEDIIWGYDVLLSALHLTASTLALRAPEVTFRLLHLYNIPLGGPAHSLGSIEFLRENSVPIRVDMFGGESSAAQVAGRGDLRGRIATMPSLDVCVMNPPFTRSVGGNLLFGSLPDAERIAMQKDLAKLLKNPRVHASGTAGLGSVFVATGDLHLKPGGRMALVLPKALLSGVAWEKTRRLISQGNQSGQSGQGYELEYLVASHDPERWNFSENTDLSEVLVVARKLDAKEEVTEANRVVCVNLWKNPRTAVEALNIAHTLVEAEPPDIASGQGAEELWLGNTKYGEAVSVPWQSIKDGSWMPPCAFGQSELLRAAHHLMKGNLYLPGRGLAGSVPLVSLGQLGSLGPDRRDIHDGFRLARGRTAYPAFWSHDAAEMVTMAQNPNRYLSPLGRAKVNRPLRKVQDLWPKAGRVLIAERTWLKTQRLAAVLLENPVLSNVWWPLKLDGNSPEDEKSLVLWLNSTLGLLMLWCQREETRGAWMDFKKPTLTSLLVLHVASLSEDQRNGLALAYDLLSSQPLLPFPQMAHDPTRKAIDDAVAQALGLPDFSILRELLAQEPVVCLKPLT